MTFPLLLVGAENHHRDGPRRVRLVGGVAPGGTWVKQWSQSAVVPIDEDPQFLSLFAFGAASSRLSLPPPDLYRDRWVRLEIVVPARVSVAASI